MKQLCKVAGYAALALGASLFAGQGFLPLDRRPGMQYHKRKDPLWGNCFGRRQS